MVKSATITIIVLVVLLVVAGAFIGYQQYTQTKQERQTVLLQQGAQIGYQQAVVQLYQEAIKCNQVPVTIQNQTINVIAVECLQAAAAQQQAQ